MALTLKSLVFYTLCTKDVATIRLHNYIYSTLISKDIIKH